MSRTYRCLLKWNGNQNGGWEGAFQDHEIQQCLSWEMSTDFWGEFSVLGEII